LNRAIGRRPRGGGTGRPRGPLPLQCALPRVDRLRGSRGDDKIIPAKATTRCTLAPVATVSYARDADGVDHIDCGGGFDKVETIHRDDEILTNCERTLVPRRGHI
jgi:hypothetical protein